MKAVVMQQCGELTNLCYFSILV